jgi:dinuclear metal center YbgI/SA1388 family protein
MPAATSEILAEIDRLLEPERFEDYCVNGLQVAGAESVETIATGVSAHAELFELAAGEAADLLLVHHGLFWGSGTTAVDAQLKRRLQLLFDNDIALAAYHLPLDAHPQLGNNALLAQALGALDADELTPFALHRGQPIGFIATLSAGRPAGDEPPGSPGDAETDDGEIRGPIEGGAAGGGLLAEELFARVASVTNRQPLVFNSGPPRVRRLAIVSGAGADYIADAADAGADALLTGELAERSMALARESHIHLIGAGHYATETFGVRHLGETLAAQFGLRHICLDVPNPI